VVESPTDRVMSRATFDAWTREALEYLKAER
jgi:hypothetical protein